MRAGLYARVSTREQAEEGLSLSAQVVALRSYCAEQGWTVSAEYVDEGLSAAREGALQRPMFRRMLEDAESGVLDVVIVHKLDRFSRNVGVTVESLGRLEKAGAAFVSLTERMDYTTPHGKLMMGMMASWAQFYSDNLGTEVSKGRAERARMGLWNGDLPFGYAAKDARSTPEIVPAEGAAVRQLFERYAAGTSTGPELARWMNDCGFEPRSKVVGRRTRFTKATVLDMLGNPFYTGQVRYRGTVLPGRHQGIVSDELFELVQMQRSKARRGASSRKARPARVYMLRGIAHCSRCGSQLWCGTSAKGAQRRYRDASRGRATECETRRKSVDAAVLEDAMGRVMELLEMPEGWASVVSRLAMTGPGNAEETRRKRRAIQERLSRARDVYLDGDLSLAGWRGEQSKAKAELEELASSGAEEIEAEVAVEMLRDYGRLWHHASEAERAAMVGALFEEVYVDTEAGCIAGVKPRAAFGPALGLLWGRGVLLGDPDRPRVDRAALYTPYLRLIESGHAWAVEVAG